jgi:phosphatidylethanolamine/phosphatidyl-N-methylethanolamine N-methyltransferase
MRYWTECREFFGQFRRQYHTTGSLLPSSRALGRALTRPMRQGKGPRRILEVGPGTGAVTAEIVRALKPGDVLDIVEINTDFVAVLERRFAEEPAFRRRRPQARIVHAPLADMPGLGVYDFMISGLPLNNFGVDFVKDIFGAYERLLKPAGVLSYFEYLSIRAMKMPLVSLGERARLQALGHYLEGRIRQAQIAEDVVLWNLPPAVARHFRFGPGS